jgi:hypothetical protein
LPAEDRGHAAVARGVRGDPAGARSFFTLPGHQDVAVESGVGVVLAELDGRYVTVEKIGLAGEIAGARYDELA